MSEHPIQDVEHTRLATDWFSVATPPHSVPSSVASVGSWQLQPPMVGASVGAVAQLGPSHIPPQQQQQPQLPLLQQVQQQQQQQQQQQLQQQHGLADPWHGMTSLSCGGGGVVVQPAKCESNHNKWVTFKFLLHKAGFPTNAPDLVHQQSRKTIQQRAQALSSIYVQHQAHIDHEWLEEQKTKCLFNWNRQIGGLVLFIDNCKDELQGYDSRMLDHLAACIHLVMARCDVLVKGDCMKEFQKTMPGTKFDWKIHKLQFVEFKKDCGDMKGMTYGAFGAWQPCFVMGVAFVVHIKVPSFAEYQHGDKDKAKDAIHQACCGHSKENAWWAKVDIHCSDNDGQRQEDVWNHMCGINVMLKYMVNASDHMMDIFDIASNMTTENPNNPLQTVQWQVRLCKDTRMTPLKVPKAEETPKIYSNGVLLQVPSASDVRQREEQMPSQAGVCGFTSLQTGQAVRDRVSGTSQALAIQKAQFVCQHNLETFVNSVSCFMEVDPFGNAFLNTPVFNIGQWLFATELEKATKRLLAILAQAAKQGCMPPGFSLRQAKDTFSMWAHLTDGDFDHPDPTTQLQVRQALMHAAFKKDDLMVTSDHPVSVTMTAYDKASTSSQFDSLQDGDDVTYQTQDGSSLRTVEGLKIGFCLVFGFDATGLHIKKYGSGLMYWQKSYDLNVEQTAGFLKVMAPRLKTSIGAALWENFQTPQAASASAPAAPPVHNQMSLSHVFPLPSQSASAPAAPVLID